MSHRSPGSHSRALLRLVRPGYRPSVPRLEAGWSRGVLTAISRAAGAWPALRRIHDGIKCLRYCMPGAREQGVDLLDSHFAYPDGYGASYLARWLSIPFVVTLRGTEVRCCKTPFANADCCMPWTAQPGRHSGQLTAGCVLPKGLMRQDVSASAMVLMRALSAG